ncbi:MAG: hypothetical protein KC620_26470, partial [Myxococcales bacterium]|nr:hypothetical protein [Myxococcales bacterium]
GLFNRAPRLVANHPVALRAPEHLQPAVRFADGTPFAWHLRIGAGEVVLLGDSSLFINLMLDAGDNARFAANVGSWLGRDGATPIVLVSGPAPLSGQYGGPGLAQGAVDDLNRALGDLGAQLAPDEIVLHALIALLLAAVLIYAVAVFPGGSAEASRPPPVRPGSSRAERAAGRPDGPAAPELAALNPEEKPR